MRNIKIKNIQNVKYNNCYMYDYILFDEKTKRVGNDYLSNLSDEEISKYSDYYNDFIHSIIDKSDYVIFFWIFR